MWLDQKGSYKGRRVAQREDDLSALLPWSCSFDVNAGAVTSPRETAQLSTGTLYGHGMAISLGRKKGDTIEFLALSCSSKRALGPVTSPREMARPSPSWPAQ